MGSTANDLAAAHFLAEKDKEIARLQGQVAVKDEALRPFAGLADAHEASNASTAKHFRDEGLPTPPSLRDGYQVTTDLGACRTARAALSSSSHAVGVLVPGANWDQRHVELAQKIMTYLGHSTEPSREPGADRLRDHVSGLIGAWEETAIFDLLALLEHSNNVFSAAQKFVEASPVDANDKPYLSEDTAKAEFDALVRALLSGAPNGKA